MTAGLSLDGVTIVRKGQSIVHDVTGSVTPGSIVAIIGSAGTGKSTLLEVLAGQRIASAGSIYLDGVSIRDAHESGQVGFVAQAHDLVPTLTAVENVALAALAHGVRPDEAWERSATWLNRLDVPKAAQANLAEELSGGQHQRVALARALAGGYALVAADEPTSELDATSEQRAFDALRLAAAHGAIVVVATASDLLRRLATHVIDLDSAQQQMLGPLDDRAC
jgi:ABC-type lipoprotein export system ATPase subunit